MQAPPSILCFCPLQTFPWKNKLIKSFLLYYFILVKQLKDTAVAKVVITSIFVSCDTETSGNYLGSHKHCSAEGQYSLL